METVHQKNARVFKALCDPKRLPLFWNYSVVARNVLVF